MEEWGDCCWQQCEVKEETVTGEGDVEVEEENVFGEGLSLTMEDLLGFPEEIRQELMKLLIKKGMEQVSTEELLVVEEDRLGYQWEAAFGLEVEECFLEEMEREETV